jgi:hypothetical protein
MYFYFQKEGSRVSLRSFFVFCSLTFSFVFFYSVLLLYVTLILYRTHYSSVYPSFLVIFFLGYSL